jgi:ElaB/YqjD/DUF883 family membrane-anchored ribosome-binding protein
MGDLSDAMQRLVGDIRSSTESRHVKISEMTSDSHNQIERFRLERQDLTKTLNEKLSSDNSAGKKATKQYLDNVRADFQSMAKALNEKLSSDNSAGKNATKQYLDNVRADFQSMAKALNEKLSSDNSAGKNATKQYLDNVKADFQSMAKALNEKLSSDNSASTKATQQLMTEFASDRGTAQRIWRTGLVGVLEKPVQPVPEVAIEKPILPAVEEVAVEEPVQLAPEKEVESFSEKHILEVIVRHSDGIKLVDIGNELGVDWRGLISTVKSLVDDGKIDKIDNLYSPKS